MMFKKTDKYLRWLYIILTVSNMYNIKIKKNLGKIS